MKVCPDCEHEFSHDELAWAYQRFGRYVCSMCGWHGERMRTPPLVPRDVVPVKRWARRIA